MMTGVLVDVDMSQSRVGRRGFVGSLYVDEEPRELDVLDLIYEKREFLVVFEGRRMAGGGGED